MADLGALRSALAATVVGVGGIRHGYPKWPDALVVPCAVVELPEAGTIVTYDRVLNEASYWNLTVLVLISMNVKRVRQDELDAYLSSTGDNSVKKALEADPTLGGKAMSLIVDEAHDIGEYAVAGVTYLGAKWKVRVLA